MSSLREFNFSSNTGRKPHMYGQYYWMILRTSGDDVYVYADRVEVNSGSIVFYSTLRGGEEIPTAVFAPGTWADFYAASCLDGAPVSIENYVWNRPEPESKPKIRPRAKIGGALEQPTPAVESITSGVYLVKSGGRYKIGMSMNVPSRIKQLQTSSADNLVHLHTIAHKNPSTLERELHERFNAKHIRGEWFALDPKDVIDIMDM